MGTSDDFRCPHMTKGTCSICQGIHDELSRLKRCYIDSDVLPDDQVVKALVGAILGLIERFQLTDDPIDTKKNPKVSA